MDNSLIGKTARLLGYRIRKRSGIRWVESPTGRIINAAFLHLDTGKKNDIDILSDLPVIKDMENTFGVKFT